MLLFSALPPSENNETTEMDTWMPLKGSIHPNYNSSSSSPALGFRICPGFIYPGLKISVSMTTVETEGIYFVLLTNLKHECLFKRIYNFTGD